MTSCEYLIPTLVFEQIENKMARVEVLKTDAVWQGITYKEDKEKITHAINEMRCENIYPNNLWQK